jgi:Dynein heavy chain C-terminal domain
VVQVPSQWRQAGPPSTGSLTAWLARIRHGADFLAQWLERGEPRVFHLPALKHPRALLAAALQRYARRLGVPVDELTPVLEVTCLQAQPGPEQVRCLHDVLTGVRSLACSVPGCRIVVASSLCLRHCVEARVICINAVS